MRSEKSNNDSAVRRAAASTSRELTVAVILVAYVAVTTLVLIGAGCDSTTSGPSGAGGAPGDLCGAVPCDDGFSCTIDVCTDNVCLHTIGPNQGETACPAGSYCELAGGCIAAPPCATTKDCTDHWMGDACKQGISCDPVSSLCTFKILDKDADGHAPPVCGGGDCDDSDKDRFPGNPEVCNGKDNDCDGVPDNGATCAGALEACQQGACKCKPENDCGGGCADLATSNDNCGECGNFCGDGTCVNGQCNCGPLTKCGTSCADTKNDYANCGACGNACDGDQTCVNGVCKCPTGTNKVCDGVCIDTLSDAANCGDCGAWCSDGEYCVCENGECAYDPDLCFTAGTAGGA